MQRHIFAIYGLVRIADETVDTYTGSDRGALLEALKTEVYAALLSNYSTNPVVHAFVNTAREYAIDARLIDPFFESMRMDLTPKKYTKKLYEQYIFGSAEVIGLMCLKVFTAGKPERYEELEAGAKALGAAYQKVNFLRDVAGDYREQGRFYFPGVTFASLKEADKKAIVQDIREDFEKALPYLRQLPPQAKKAVHLSYLYYSRLLTELERTPIASLKKKRVRLSGSKKALIAASQLLPSKGVK